jgi:hypothetical protein
MSTRKRKRNLLNFKQKREIIDYAMKHPKSTERTNDPGQATGKLYHLRLRVECTLFVIYKAGRELTPYW